MATRTCSTPDCGKAHRAKGLCVTHYNQAHQPGRHRGTSTQCTVCHAPVVRQARNDRRPACSTQCRTILEHGAAAGNSAYVWATDAMRRARSAGAVVVDRITRHEVFERDQWVCYLCNESTDQGVDALHPDSPTVDHVLPLSRGGQHTLANVATAHLRCNSSKQDHFV